MKFPGARRRPPFVTLPRHIDGVSSKESKHAIKLTSQGWEAKGLD